MRKRAKTSVTAFIGLGGNVGDPVSTLRSATHRLMTVPRSRYLGMSRLYRTLAWGQREQPDFVNAVVALDTALAPSDLLGELLAIEREFGRRRAEDGSDRWGPRVLDLDILLYGEEVVDLPALKIPHPHLHERAFALVPLLDMVDDIAIGELGSARGLLQRLDRSGISPLPER